MILLNDKRRARKVVRENVNDRIEGLACGARNCYAESNVNVDLSQLLFPFPYSCRPFSIFVRFELIHANDPVQSLQLP